MPNLKNPVESWATLSVGLGNAVQLCGLLGAVVLARRAGKEGGAQGTRLMVASRLLAYFSEHAFSHWLVWRVVGIRFSGYGLHGTSHPRAYPPGARFLFSHLPLLSARRSRVAERGAACGAGGDVCCGHGGDRGPEPRHPGLLSAAQGPWGERLLRFGEPVERAAALERGSAPGRRPAPGVGRVEEAPGVARRALLQAEARGDRRRGVPRHAPPEQPGAMGSPFCSPG
jgi:hypothetical protein